VKKEFIINWQGSDFVKYECLLHEAHQQGLCRIATTLIHNLLDRDARIGLATMCIGVGQGIASVWQRV